MRIGSALALSGAVYGCAAHASLPLSPAADSTEPERAAFYARHRTHETVYASNHDDGDTRRRIIALRLTSGETVDAADDLRPLVAEDSRTARFGRQSRDWRTAAAVTLGAGLTAVAVGALLIVPAATLPPSNASIPLFAVGGVLAGGGVIAAIASVAPQNAARDAAHDAFASFDEDFQARLRLSVRRDESIRDASPQTETIIDTTAVEQSEGSTSNPPTQPERR